MQRVIEALESRIAPAAVFTYTEADGDEITIKTSAKISNSDFADFIANHSEFSLESGNRDLLFLDLANSIFRNSSLTISVTKTGGNGLASIGDIYTNVDLKNVIINGNLGSIVAGDRNAATPALSTLQVQNLGGDGESSSYFVGNVKAIKVLGDLTGDINGGGFALGGIGAQSLDDSYGLGNIGVLNVGGSVTSSADIAARTISTLKVGGDMAGDIFARTLKSVRIGGDVVGGAEGGGTILGGSIKSIRIVGDIIGGDSSMSGGIGGLSIGNVIVGGNIAGGSGDTSGFILGFELGKVTVLGDVVGNSGYLSGVITGFGDITSIRVDGSLIAGGGDSSGSIVATSLLGLGGLGGEGGLFDGMPLFLGSLIGGEVGKIVVGGSLIGSQEVSDGQGGTTTVSGIGAGSISALTIASLRIGGDILGGDGDYSASVSGNSLTAAVIGGEIRGGDGFNSATIDFNGIGSIRVVESVTGGTGPGSASIVGDHGIGSVKIGGALTGGAHQSGSIAAFEGNIDSVVIGGAFSNQLDKTEGFTGIYAAGSIGRVTIGGGASGGDYGTLGIRAGAVLEYGEDPNAALPAIGSVSIKGDASNLMIESGVELDGNVNFYGSIGSVNITGNFIKSSISAGIGAGEDGFYGTSDDASLNPGIEHYTSRIASVVIGGTASGTPAVEIPANDPANLDSYGIFAGHIVALKIAGAKKELTVGAANDTIARVIAGDVTYKETALSLV